MSLVFSNQDGITSRRARFQINPSFLQIVITEGWGVPFDESLVCVEGVPKDAKFIDAYWDNARQCFFVIYEHESFDPVDYGAFVPVRSASYSTSYRNPTPDN